MENMLSTSLLTNKLGLEMRKLINPGGSAQLRSDLKYPAFCHSSMVLEV